MKEVERVIFLEEASDDLEAGKDFYESKESGVGVYFATSLLSDISSLRLYAGIHPIRYGFFACSQSDSPLRFTMISMRKLFVL